MACLIVGEDEVVPTLPSPDRLVKLGDDRADVDERDQGVANHVQNEHCYRHRAQSDVLALPAPAAQSPSCAAAQQRVMHSTAQRSTARRSTAWRGTARRHALEALAQATCQRYSARWHGLC